MPHAPASPGRRHGSALAIASPSLDVSGELRSPAEGLHLEPLRPDEPHQLRTAGDRRRLPPEKRDSPRSQVSGLEDQITDLSCGESVFRGCFSRSGAVGMPEAASRTELDLDGQEAVASHGLGDLFPGELRLADPAGASWS